MKHDNISTQLLQLLSTEQAWHYGALPVGKEGDALICLVAEPRSGLLEELELLTGVKVLLDIVGREEFIKHLSFYKPQSKQANSQQTKLSLDSRSDKDFLVQLVMEAQQLNSSDIHLEPYENQARVRLRLDGKLVERYILDKQEYPSLVNKVKIKANLDIAEKRLPQDGRIAFNFGGLRLDIRVSVLPVLHGEKVVMRLLQQDASNIDLMSLGMSGGELERYLEGVRRPNGMVLISGPTGSGKTTTLYATLKLLNDVKSNILTIEDPIEYTLEGINQVQLRDEIGLGFAMAMRTFLRQNPDIIMVGEVRDKDTADMSIRVSLTGHLVLSTIHTNSAWGVVARLIDMGVPPFLLADTLKTTVAQRLVRKLCPHCKYTEVVKADTFPPRFKLPRPIETIMLPLGCPHCHFTGYKGRVAVYEVITLDAELAACARKGETDISALLKERNIKTLSENTFTLIEQGITSPLEAYSLLD